MLIPVTLHPSPRQLRTFGLIAAAITAIVGVSFYVRGHTWGITVQPDAATRLGYSLWAAAAVEILVAFAIPKAFVPLYVVLTIITLPIGFVLSHVLIGTLFFVFITPIAMVMKLTGRDAMTRKLDRAATTYWTKRPEANAKRYLRQY